MQWVVDDSMMVRTAVTRTEDQVITFFAVLASANEDNGVNQIPQFNSRLTIKLQHRRQWF